MTFTIKPLKIFGVYVNDQPYYYPGGQWFSDLPDGRVNPIPINTIEFCKSTGLATPVDSRLVFSNSGSLSQ